MTAEGGVEKEVEWEAFQLSICVYREEPLPKLNSHLSLPSSEKLRVEISFHSGVKVSKLRHQKDHQGK